MVGMSSDSNSSDNNHRDDSDKENVAATSWSLSWLESFLLPRNSTSQQPVVGDGPVKEELARVQSNCLLRSPAAAGRSTSSLEHHLEERPLPDRWVDFFCLVGMDAQMKKELLETGYNDDDDGDGWEENPTETAAFQQQQPQLLDSYPKKRMDMEVPHHLPTFCFPNGYKSIRVRRKKKDSAVQPRLPEPELSTIVLTIASGHRLYGTILTVYERLEADLTRAGDDNDDDDGESSRTSHSVRVRVAEPYHKHSSSTTTTAEIECRLQEDDEFDWMVPKCLVLLSHFPFFHAQSTMLKELFYTINSGTSPLPWERYVAHIVEDIPLPLPGRTSIEWTSWTGGPTIQVTRPAPNQLSLLNVSFEPLFRTLSLSNILVIWATLLQEGKVVLCTKPETFALLTPIAEALLCLLFPLEWQGIYVPVLPNQKHTMDILEAPIPYLVGITMDKKKNRYRQPHGVLWCDLDNDIVHLGWTDDGVVRTTLPALPEAASMRLKIDLEQVADPLFLPPPCGRKGRMTVGQWSNVYLENLARHPYAQMTRVHDPHTRPSPRSYILSQAAKVPPRGTALLLADYRLSRDANETSKRNCCAPLQTGGGAENHQQGSDGVDESRGPEDVDDKSLYVSLMRQSRSMQAHADRLLSVFGQDFATPSAYTSRGDDMLSDILEHQDEIASKFFAMDDRWRSERVRSAFLRFFTTILCEYKSYVDKDTQRLDIDRFVRSLNMSKRNQEYVRTIVENQMFELFLQSNSSRRRFFDEMIIRSAKGCVKEGEGGIPKTRPSETPFLDSTRWNLQTVLIPPPPCSSGIVAELAPYSSDRRFPDHLKADECVTGVTYRERTDESWQNAFCSVLLSCTG